jgi:hypothetical protein
MAAAEGRLEASPSNNPFAAAKTDVGLAATVDEAEAQAEAAAVALLAAERFAALLASNAERLGPTAGLKVGSRMPPPWRPISKPPVLLTDWPPLPPYPIRGPSGQLPALLPKT